LRIFLANVEIVTERGQQIRRAAFDRTGVTEYAVSEIRPDRFVVVAQGIDIAPAGTIDLGTSVTVLPSNREVQVANFLGVTRAEVAGKTIGELILLLDGGTWIPTRDGKIRISLAGVTLLERDAIQGGAVEITEPFTYSNGRLSTVSSAAWDDTTANMAVSSNAVVWSAAASSGIASHNTELSSVAHYAQTNVTISTTDEYAGGGVIVRHDGSVGGTEDGYRVEVGHWGVNSYNWAITRIDNGTGTEVASQLGISAGTTSVHELRAEVEGTTITLFVDDVEEGSYGSASSYTTNKFVGIYAGKFAGGNVTLDAFEAGALDLPPPVPVVVTTAGSGNSATSTATLAFDCGNSFAIGDVIVVCISADNNGASGVSSLTSVTDAGGNVYELLQATYDPGAAAAGQTVGIAWARITTALITTDDVTINFSPNTVSKAAVVHKLDPDTGITIQKVTSGFTAGSATGTPTVTTATVTIGDVVIAAIAAESNAAFTGDSDTTNGSWSTQTTAVGNTGTSGTSSRVASQTKIVTATATQTYNPTITSCDNILGWIIFTPAFIRWDRVAVRPSQAVHRSRNW
jgi:hypothetical protein